ncbi:MAG: diacylglycerol kinase [Myxococcaceae bacterium]|nr:diacylglycerol kinase [Myxococcaceae bacterium]
MKLEEAADVAVLFNSHARGVTPDTVRRFRQALPQAQVRVCDDLSQQERHLATLMKTPPRLLLCGGGDGTATHVVNTLRRLTAHPPALGLLRLGTGNAWARTLGAPKVAKLLPRLGQLTFPLPTRPHRLVDVEGIACPFAGVGWDAALLNDYQHQRDLASGRLFTSPFSRWLHTGLRGYVYAAGRFTVPRELGRSLWHLALQGTLHAANAVLYQGPVNVAGFSTVAEYGFGLRAFPLAPAHPQQVNIRVLHAPLQTTLRHLPALWRGAATMRGVSDFFVTQARWEFSRPVALQIAGDPTGLRQSLEVQLSPTAVQVVDWHTVQR